MQTVLYPRRLVCTALLACTTVLLLADSASAQRFRRGARVGVGVGVYGPAAYGYGYDSYRYGPGYAYGSPVVYSSPTVGYTGTSYYSYPTSAYSYPATTYAASGCCDPCATSYAMAPQGTTHSAGYMPASSEQGLRIVEVHQGPAQSAGIVAGSVIDSFDGQKVRSMDQLQTALKNGQSGQAAKITIIDPNGQRQTRNLNLKDNKLGVSVVETSVFIPNENGSSQPNRQDGTIPQPQPNRPDTIPQPQPSRTDPIPDRTPRPNASELPKPSTTIPARPKVDD